MRVRDDNLKLGDRNCTQRWCAVVTESVNTKKTWNFHHLLAERDAEVGDNVSDSSCPTDFMPRELLVAASAALN